MKQMLCELITPYRCCKCNQDTLFFCTNTNTLIDYKTLFFKGYTLNQIREYLQYKNVRYLKCIACGSMFIIDWRDGYPFPLKDNSCLLDFGFDL